MAREQASTSIVDKTEVPEKKRQKTVAGLPVCTLTSIDTNIDEDTDETDDVHVEDDWRAAEREEARRRGSPARRKVDEPGLRGDGGEVRK